MNTQTNKPMLKWDALTNVGRNKKTVFNIIVAAVLTWLAVSFVSFVNESKDEMEYLETVNFSLQNRIDQLEDKFDSNKNVVP